MGASMHNEVIEKYIEDHHRRIRKDLERRMGKAPIEEHPVLAITFGVMFAMILFYLNF